MADRTVSVKLKADISDYTAGLAKAAAATRAMTGDVEKTVDRDLPPILKRSGDKSGGILAQGINVGLVRNSPLIVAGIAGALAAGAPVALAGAAVLFAGIGGLAAAQTQQVQAAWKGLGTYVRDSAVSDAAVLVPVYEDMADKIGASFARMRPEIRDAFEASAPHIQAFTDGITGAAENALPGLVRAVESGGPVIDGLASLMEDVGTGLSDFFDAMSDNSSAAGTALEAIGEALGEALPLLGELLGTGAEIASVVLPPLADALGVVAKIAEKLGPVLPVLVAGFVGFKAVSAAAGYLQTFAVKAQDATTAMTRNEAAGSKVGGALSTIAGALPAVGIGVGVVATAMQHGEQEADRYAKAMMSGGAASEKAFAEAGRNDIIESLTKGFGGLGTLVGLWTGNTKEAEAAQRALWESMSPVEQAQSKVAEWTATLGKRYKDLGPNAEETAIAQQRVAYWSGEAARRQSELDMALRGVTDAMLLQQEQAFGFANADLAHRQSVDATEDAYANLQKVIRETPGDFEAVEDATFQYETALLRQVEAARRVSEESLPATMDATQKTALANLSALDTLYALRDQYGDALPASLRTQIATLEQSTTGMDRQVLIGDALRAKLGELGGAAVVGAAGNESLKQQLYNTAVQMGLSEDAAWALTDQIISIPDSSNTNITADTRPAQSAIDGFVTSNSGRSVNLTATFSSNITRDAQAARNYAAGRASGGPIFGPGTATSDSIPAWLSTGEYVVRASSVGKYGMSFMDALNKGSLPQFADGGPVTLRAMISTDGAQRSLDAHIQAVTQAAQAAAQAAAGPLGGGALGGGWQSIASAVQAAIPQARINSTFRPGDPGYHGRGKAVDFGYGSGPGGAGSAGLASINRFLHDSYGSNLAELIYDGIGDDRPDLKNGRPLTYNAATRAQHANHVHAAVYHGGTDYVPETGWAYLERGEAVVPAAANPSSREFSGVSSGMGGGGSFSVPAPVVKVFLDGQEWRGMARVEAEGVVVSALTGSANRGRNNS